MLCDEERLTLDGLPAVGLAIAPVVIAGQHEAARARTLERLELRIEAALVLGALLVPGRVQAGGIDVVAEQCDRDAITPEHGDARARFAGEGVEQRLPRCAWRAGVSDEEERRIERSEPPRNAAAGAPLALGAARGHVRQQ